jgi:selenocysteine lyase/cysteine desulfurase
MNANAEKDGHMRPSAIERAARAWEEKAKEILQRHNEQVAYCTGYAEGLREALRILGREE